LKLHRIMNGTNLILCKHTANLNLENSGILIRNFLEIFSEKCKNLTLPQLVLLIGKFSDQRSFFDRIKLKLSEWLIIWPYFFKMNGHLTAKNKNMIKEQEVFFAKKEKWTSKFHLIHFKISKPTFFSKCQKLPRLNWFFWPKGIYIYLYIFLIENCWT
jgi:hypothetical protein